MRGFFVVAILFSSLVAQGSLPEFLPQGLYEKGPTEKSKMKLPKGQEEEIRNEALLRSQVWKQPPTPIELADLSQTEVGQDGFTEDSEVFCKWIGDRYPSGFTPKFYCTTPSGDVLKVKYSPPGKLSEEIYSEPLATRLLSTLGFGADRVYIVKKIRCFGCPEDPYDVSVQLNSEFPEVRKKFMQLRGERGENGEYIYKIDYSKHLDFYGVTIERRMANKRIETDKVGWSWAELDLIDQKRGGASKAEIDAFRIITGFINHADNKPDNQALVCTDRVLRDDGYCEAPVAMINDPGTSFGSGFKLKHLNYFKLDLNAWMKRPVFEEGCRVKIKSAPNGSFKNTEVSNAGVRLASSLLEKLSENQIRDLFNGVHLSELSLRHPEDSNVELWVQAFKKRRAEISSQVCPTSVE